MGTEEDDARVQRQLLPPGLPVLPAVRIAASYLPAGAAAAGGDWFDAAALPGGRVALVVGDVVGHGVAASAAMGQLRAVLHDRLEETGDLLAAFRAADRTARRVPEARAATVCGVVLNPADGTLTLCSAGHPPPLLAGPDGARYLAVRGTGPLGTGADYATATDRLQSGEVALLYSDGIIERPGRTPDAATVELAQVAAEAIAERGAGRSAAERACARTLEVLVGRTGHADDITLLAAQLRAPAPPLRLTGPAAPSMVPIVRTAVESWVDVVEGGEPDRIALAHAVVELVTNAWEHGRPDKAEGTVTVTAQLHDDGVASLVVADDGRWREPARPGRRRGFGLAMARSFADDLDAHHDAGGTTVTVRRRLAHPARLLTAAELGRGAARTARSKAARLRIVERPGRIAVHGALDAASVEDLGVALDRRTHGGIHELVVDLTGVTHLASAAVAELYRTSTLRLYAPAGSPAQHVLSLVGLPHTTSDPQEPAG